jgi:hypothetical protein
MPDTRPDLQEQEWVIMIQRIVNEFARYKGANNAIERWNALDACCTLMSGAARNGRMVRDRLLRRL